MNSIMIPQSVIDPEFKVADLYFNSRFPKDYASMEENPNYESSGCGIAVTALDASNTLTIADPANPSNTICNLEYNKNGLKFVYSKPKMIDNVVKVGIGSTEKLNILESHLKILGFNLVKKYGGIFNVCDISDGTVMCYGNNKVIVFTGGSQLLYSSDGLKWDSTSTTKAKFRSVCYGKDKFVAVAFDSNIIAYSTDGIAWTKVTNGTNNKWWNSICYGKDKFVTVNRNGTYAYSTDGINWTVAELGYVGQRWNSICYGKDKFVAVTDDGGCAYSTDGIKWSYGKLTDKQSHERCICYSNGVYVVTCKFTNFVNYSTDGINWVQRVISEVNRSWQPICYGNGKFVAVTYDSNVFAYSTDGITWTEGTIGNTKFMSEQFAYNPELSAFFVCGSDANNKKHVYILNPTSTS